MPPDNHLQTPPINPPESTTTPPPTSSPVATAPKRIHIGRIIGITIAGVLVSAGTVVGLLILNANTIKTTPTTATVQSTSATTTKEDVFARMDQVSTGTETASTRCYTFTIPKDYTAHSNTDTCTVTMTNSTDSTTTITTDVLLSEYCNQMDDLVSCINSRYEQIAQEANRTFYGARKVSINTYSTGLAYLDSADGRKRAHYTIENAGRTSKATTTTYIDAFSIVGFADTDAYDADTRLIAQSFAIIK